MWEVDIQAVRHLLRSRRARIVLAGVMLALVAVVAVGGHYAIRAYLTKTQGVVLKTAATIEPRDVTFFLQNDPAWATQTLGASSYRMGGSGCLVSCIASALGTLGVATDPGRVNQAFTAAGVYDAEGDVVWKHITRAYPRVGYRYSRVFDAKRIEADLRSGLRPLLGVGYLGGSAQHWVEVVGADGQDFLVMDPLARERAPIPLSRHGRVFYYRVLVPVA